MITFTCDRYDIPVRLSYYEIASTEHKIRGDRGCILNVRVITLNNGQQFPVKDTVHLIEKKIEDERLRLESEEIESLKHTIENFNQPKRKVRRNE